MVVPWCPPRGESFFFPSRGRRLRKEGIVPHSVVNSCFATHDARANSWSTLHAARINSGSHANSCRCTYNSCGGVRGGTKPRSMSAWRQGWCPAVEKLASSQQAPGRLHVETWAGRGDNPSLWISQEVEIIPGCADTVVRLPSPSLSSVSPGPGREVRNWLGWTPLEKTARSGVWGPRCFGW